MMHPGEAIVALVSIVMTGLILYPLVRALARRVEGSPSRKAPELPAANDPRLERMEQAIEAIAVEIERISEAQRFTTKLLSERNAPSAMPGDTSRRS
jgi:hypothetical protein